MTAYRALFRLGLTRVDAERAHRLGFAALRAADRVPGAVRLAAGSPGAVGPVRAFGLDFRGPLGLAAGFDKNAVGIEALAAVGFDFVEVGTVTAQPQPGNPRPRLFRLVDDQAVVNRMGFNNDGAEAVARRLVRWRSRRRPAGERVPVLGVNIGRSRATPDDEAVADYEMSARLLAPHTDYLVVNVSSPNTPGLRDLQSTDRLQPLLSAVRETADGAAGRHVPLLAKIAPDLPDEDVAAIARTAVESGLDGLVAVNTTVSRAGLRSPRQVVDAAGPGGLSGRPLTTRSLAVLGVLREAAPSLPVVSVGGVWTADDVLRRLAAGAVLVQAYTAFVYEGPRWPSRVRRGLAAASGRAAGG